MPALDAWQSLLIVRSRRTVACMTADEQRQEARDLVRYFGATVEEIAEALGIDPDHAAALCAETHSSS